MAPSGPCSRGMPKAEVWTGGRRMEPAPSPTMLWRPAMPERSPTKDEVHSSTGYCYSMPSMFQVLTVKTVGLCYCHVFNSEHSTENYYVA